jgi:hypothetical protein
MCIMHDLDIMSYRTMLHLVTPAEALRDIKGYASANRFNIHPHALKRARERGATRAHIQAALTNATTCVVGQMPGRWEVVGTDLDGDPLKLAVVFEDGLLVITLF